MQRKSKCSSMVARTRHKAEKPVMSCRMCEEQSQAHTKDPLISRPLPEFPWKKIVFDLCEHKYNYSVTSDYYSRFLKVLHLPSTTSTQIVQRLNAVTSDNRPVFSYKILKAAITATFQARHIQCSSHSMDMLKEWFRPLKESFIRMIL